MPPVVTLRDAVVPTVGHGGDTRNALRYIMDAHTDEPLFVIRGRDVLAVPVITEYLNTAMLHGIDNMASQVLAHQRRFIEWQLHHPHLIKFPDPYKVVK